MQILDVFIVIVIVIMVSAIYINSRVSNRKNKPNLSKLKKDKVWIYDCLGNVVVTPVEKEYDKYFSFVSIGYIFNRFELLPGGKTTCPDYAPRWGLITSEPSSELEALYLYNNPAE